MNTNEIQGELMKLGLNAGDIAAMCGCSKSLAQKAIRRERVSGPAVDAIRKRVADLLRLPVDEVWEIGGQGGQVETVAPGEATPKGSASGDQAAA